jgi:phosphoserine phosphatase
VIYAVDMKTVFVDLDKTLITKNSSTIELFKILNEKNSTTLFREILGLPKINRSNIKELLTMLNQDADFSGYFSKNVISILKKYKEENADIILATGSMEITAKRIVADYPIEIREYLTSSFSNRNKGKAKLISINLWLEKNNRESFIYIGDAFIDLVIMKKATKSYFVGNHFIYLIGKYILRIANINYHTSKIKNE